jgi:hypothetical protein
MSTPSSFRKKFEYWNDTYIYLLSVDKKMEIVNFMVVLTLWFFIMLWVGSLKLIRRCKASL